MALILCSLALMASAGANPGAVLSRQNQFDAHRLQTGEFFYRDSKQGEVLGGDWIRISRENESTYRFSTQISGPTDQQWESIASTILTPISAELSFGKGPEQPKAFQLHYANDRVTGFVLNRRSAEPKTPMPVSASIDSNTVDQRIDWAAVMALDLRRGTRFEFKVYDAITGSSEASVQVSPPHRLDVPAGSFRVLTLTYWVQKSTGAERYIVYATESLPRLMVREDFPDGTISELTKKQ
jgi:hypothetical protein